VELPEVEVMRRDLEKDVIGRRIKCEKVIDMPSKVDATTAQISFA